MFAPLLLMQGNLYTITSCKPVKSACSATDSRLQRPQLPEIQPHKMRQPRRATRSPGLFVRFDPLPLRKSVRVCQGVTPCGMLDNMILYNRPRRRGRGRGLRPRVRRAIIRTFDPWAAVRRDAVRSLLIIPAILGQDGRHATRSGGDQQAGGRRDARRLHRSAICAGAGGGRTRCAPTATRNTHIMRRSAEARDALREIMPQIMTRRAQEIRETYILLRLQADRLRDCSPQWRSKGCFLFCVCVRARGSGF